MISKGYSSYLALHFHTCGGLVRDGLKELLLLFSSLKKASKCPQFIMQVCGQIFEVLSQTNDMSSGLDYRNFPSHRRDFPTVFIGWILLTINWLLFVKLVECLLDLSVKLDILDRIFSPSTCYPFNLFNKVLTAHWNAAAYTLWNSLKFNFWSSCQ